MPASWWNLDTSTNTIFLLGEENKGNHWWFTTAAAGYGYTVYQSVVAANAGLPFARYRTEGYRIDARRSPGLEN